MASTIGTQMHETGDVVSFAISVVATLFVMFADGTIIFIIIKERLWRDDNALLIFNLMVSFLLSSIWGIFSMASDTFHWHFEFALLLSFQVLPHISSLMTLIYLAFDRVYALKKKVTLVKIHSRSYSLRRLICVWVVSGVVAVVTFTGTYATGTATDLKKEDFFTVFIVCHFTLFVISIAVITIAFLLVLRIHRQDIQLAIGKGTNNDPAWQKTNKAKWRLSFTLAGLVFGLIITWIPLYAYMLSDPGKRLEFGQKPFYVFLLLVNYAVAPLTIYACSLQFRRYFKRHFLCWPFPDVSNENNCNLRADVRRTVPPQKCSISSV